MLLQRILLAVAALAAAGWLAVSLVGEHALEHATAVSKDRKATPAALAQGLRDAERAGDLRPADTEPDLTRAQLLVGLHRNGEAIRTLEDLTRREPDNVTAWFSLAVLAAVAQDKPLAARAVASVRQLDPLDAPR
jgi:predicted Zn-dependent protease